MARTPKGDLMDRLEAVLPHGAAADMTRRIVEAMAAICGAARATAFRERAGMVRFVAGDPVPDRTLAAIRAALRTGRQAGSSRSGGSAVAMPSPGAEAEKKGGAWLLWSGRPHDAELDLVYFEGPRLRARSECTGRLTRFTALLGRLP